MNTTSSKRFAFSTRETVDKHVVQVIESTKSISLVATWRLLQYTYGLVPIVAGVDKFTNMLANWESYLSPLVLKVVPLDAHMFMGIVGVIEIVAGILVLARPRIGAYVVMAWLVCIALSLIAGGNYFDVAVRDVVMAIGAFALANLSVIVEQMKVAESRK